MEKQTTKTERMIRLSDEPASKRISNELDSSAIGKVHPKVSRRTILASGFGALAFFIAGCASSTSISVPSQSPSTQPESSEADSGTADSSASSHSDLPPLPKKGHPAPNFTLATLDGGELSLADLQGQPVILNFWASWCGPCRLEMPHLQEAHAQQGGEVAVIGINLTQRENDLDDVPSFVNEFALTFPIALDEDGDVAKLYEVRGQPASIFIDAQGVVSTVFYGPVTKNFIEERIEEIRSS